MAGEAAGRRLTGERDLARLLATMAPRLYDEPYSFRLLEKDESLAATPFAVIAEEEGLTLIMEESDGGWARISLTVHSDLEAVGLTAALSRALADVGISANVVAGYHHDHIFVPWPRRHDALAALTRLTGEA